MAEKHPYSPGGAGAITTTIRQFRDSLPSKITAETLKKLGIAPNNESYVINILRFLGVIDLEGNRTQQASSAFSKDDAGFQAGFEEMIKTAYGELFALHHDKTWNLSESQLISFFRTTDHTSALTGKRQATTFQTLASLSGRGQVPPPAAKVRQPKEPKPKLDKNRDLATPDSGIDKGSANRVEAKRDFGLTVRIEVNLPPAGDQETYDRIFRSIRENLLNAK